MKRLQLNPGTMSEETQRVLDRLSTAFPEFVDQLKDSADAGPEKVLPPASPEHIAVLQSDLGLRLPDTYKTFLRATRGFWLFGGAVQFGAQHPFFHDFPPLDVLTSAQLRVVKARGGGWPPPSAGMLCFAEYFRDADGDQVLFDVSGGLINGEYPVVYYSHEACPPFVEKLADSFGEWLCTKCLQQMRT